MRKIEVFRGLLMLYFLPASYILHNTTQISFYFERLSKTACKWRGSPDDARNIWKSAGKAILIFRGRFVMRTFCCVL